ncbi:MAG: D-beta-D-heptose 7-phosphate kinase / D-beta-D-heptose 1-phosphate adenosyltransferase [Frankiaceae bacterium]|nr:D-beta-D-heptose 7-phosphate kinase / D-beta-D-heptose 1-phosphate adenosyltransferase [Frankiaceae bacterium]
MSRVVVVGDSLLDRDISGRVERLCPDAPVPVIEGAIETVRPGGAGLAASLAAADGHDVTLVTATAHDAAGANLLSALDECGVSVAGLPTSAATAEKVRVRGAGHTLLRFDRGCELGDVSDTGDYDVLDGADVVLVADYGRGVTSLPRLREALAAHRVVWDPHPRGSLPVGGCTLVTPNAPEAALFAGETDADADADIPAVARRAAALRQRWQAGAVSVTLGALGALLHTGGGAPLVVPARRVSATDPCGAGDRFASAAAGAIAAGALPSEAVTLAVAAASAFVEAGGAAAFRPGPRATADVPARAVGDLVDRVRARGGRVVATGGCFDLLHAGHVGLLEQARALGDCLVVLLNGDDSVRRLKGASRPLQPAADRAAVLSALSSVDAVVVFDEDTPEVALSRLRPDIWAKGGDYTIDALPESPLVASWGGQVVLLPFLPGRSTTRLVQEVLAHAR